MNLTRIKYILNSNKVRQLALTHEIKNYNHASVLVPICLDGSGNVSLLFTLRSNKMRKHKGEVSFPGGKLEPQDNSLLECCLRETFEEISIKSTDIEILYELSPIEDKSGMLSVTPFIGYINHPQVNALDIVHNEEEVECVFLVSVDALLQMPKMENFRNTKMMIPYWNINILSNGIGVVSDKGTVRIWGLTGYIVYEFLKLIRH